MCLRRPGCRRPPGPSVGQSPVVVAAGEVTVPGQWLLKLQSHLLIQGRAMLGAGK